MGAGDKYRSVFGSISSLSEQVPWPDGISNMVEHLLWDTKAVLGISKTTLIRRIVEWIAEIENQEASVNEKTAYVLKKLEIEGKRTESSERYAKPISSYCVAREALRRNKYFSEDYLNKEFDIFMNLASDDYLDDLYKNYLDFELGGEWVTHGNGGMFEYSTMIKEMAMDNLAYNDQRQVLVANELKLGGKKNKDQILKYSFMHLRLINIGFIAPETRFLLLFIGDRRESINLKEEIEREQKYCSSVKGAQLCAPRIVENAKTMCVDSLTWSELAAKNDQYATRLNEHQEVERKLLLGFSTALRKKAFLQVQ